MSYVLQEGWVSFVQFEDVNILPYSLINGGRRALRWDDRVEVAYLLAGRPRK